MKKGFQYVVIGAAILILAGGMATATSMGRTLGTAIGGGIKVAATVFVPAVFDGLKGIGGGNPNPQPQPQTRPGAPLQ